MIYLSDREARVAFNDLSLKAWVLRLWPKAGSIFDPVIYGPPSACSLRSSGRGMQTVSVRNSHEWRRQWRNRVFRPCRRSSDAAPGRGIGESSGPGNVAALGVFERRAHPATEQHLTVVEAWRHQDLGQETGAAVDDLGKAILKASTNPGAEIDPVMKATLPVRRPRAEVPWRRRRPETVPVSGDGSETSDPLIATKS